MDLQQLMARVADGQALTEAQEASLVDTRDLIQLGMLACEARSQRHGRAGTFVRVEGVSLADVAMAEIPADAGEVRLVDIGEGAQLDDLCQGVATLTARTAVPVTGLVLHELAAAAGSDLPGWCRALRGAGLSAIAHARVDRLEPQWLAAVAEAGLSVLSVSLGTALAGPVLLDSLRLVRGWQHATGAIAALQPLPLDVTVTEPSTGYDDMHAVALARLVVGNVAHVQVSWQRAGAKLAQACLLFGANDVTDVPARDAMPHGPRRAIIEEVRRNIVAVSLDPVERDARGRVRELQS